MTDTTQAMTTANKPPLLVLRERLEARRAELKSALIDISPDVFIRALTTSAQINPDILACSFQSLWTACMRACRDGLLPDGVEGAIVPYKDRATWIPMYQGLLRNFRRSGQFRWITAGIVRQGEEFSHFIDEAGEHIKHVPGDNVAAPIEKIYAMATTKDAGLFITVMPVAEANKIRAMSRASREDSPWKQWPEEMYKKTVLRRLSKLLPTARDRLGAWPATEEDDPADLLLPTEPTQSTNTPSDQEKRESGASAALNAFAGNPIPEGPSETDGGGSVPQSPDTQADPAVDPVTVAYNLGKSAKAAGTRRASVPGEYRDDARVVERTAWFAGYDGTPMPEKGML